MWAVPSRVGTITETASAGRNATFAAVGGAAGVITPKALEVRPLAVPGLAVRIAPGSAAVPCRAPGVLDEMYAVRLLAEETATIAATAAAGRSDLIVARVEDPYVDGSTYVAPADPDAGPYVFTRVISNVPSDTVSAAQVSTDRSEYALARIDLPANATTVTAVNVTDLRDLTPAGHLSSRTVSVTVPAATHTLEATDLYATFPNIDLAAAQVPAWATHARVLVTAAGVAFGAAGSNTGAGWNATGDLRVQFAFAGAPGYSDPTEWTLTSPAETARRTLAVGSVLPVPVVARGATAAIRLEGRRDSTGGTNTAVLSADSSTTITLDVEFYNAVETNG